MSRQATAAATVSAHQEIKTLGVGFMVAMLPIFFAAFNALYTTAKTAVSFDALSFWLSPATKKSVFKTLATAPGEKKSSKMVSAFIRLLSPVVDLGIRSLKTYKKVLKSFNGNEAEMFEASYAFGTCTNFVKAISDRVTLPDGIAYHLLQDKVVAQFKPGEGQTVLAKRDALGTAIGIETASTEQIVAAQKKLDAWQEAFTKAKLANPDADVDTLRPARIPFAELAI